MSAVRRPASPSGWRAVLALFMAASAVEAMGVSHIFAFLPVYLTELHVRPVAAWVGVLSALSFVVGLPIVPFWGVWAERYSGKAVIIRSAVVEAAVFSLLGASEHLATVAAAMALVGLQLGNTGVMLAAIRRAVPSDRVGYGVSLFSVSSSVGMAVGPLAGGWLASATPLGLHGLYALDGALSLGMAVVLQLLYREPVRVRAAAGRPASAWREAWSSVRVIFALPVTWRLFGMFLLLMIGTQMIRPFLPLAVAAANPYAGRVTLVVGALVGFTALVGAAVAVVAGRLGDRVGFLRVLVLSLGTGALAGPLLGLLRSLGPLAGAAAGYAAATQIGRAMIFTLLSTEVPEPHRATALNLVYLPLYVAGIVGPGLASALSAFGLAVPFAVAGAVFAVGAAVAAGPRWRGAAAAG